MRSLLPFLLSFLCLGLEAQQWHWAKNMARYYHQYSQYRPVIVGNSDGGAFVLSGVPYSIASDGESRFYIQRFDMYGQRLYVDSVPGNGIEKACVGNDNTLITSGSGSLQARDQKGNIIWSRSGHALDIAMLPSGDFVYYGHDIGVSSLTRITKLGDTVWSAPLKIDLQYYTWIQDMKVVTDSKSNIYLAGYFSDYFAVNSVVYHDQPNDLSCTSYILKFNQHGNLIGTEFVTNTVLLDAAVDTNDNVFLFGESQGTVKIREDSINLVLGDDMNDASYILAKLSPDNLCEWLNEIEFFLSSESLHRCAMTVNHKGEIFLAGSTSKDSVKYCNTVLTFEGSLYVSKFGSDGNFLWTKQADGVAGASHVKVAGDGAIYILGWSSGEAIFDNLSLYAEKPSLFIAMLGDGIYLSTLETLPNSNVINIFPNPTTGQVNLHCKKDVISARVIDLYGKELFSVTFTPGQRQAFKLNGPGLRFVEVRTSEGTSSHKILVE